jgi:hypothetical protein
MNNLLQKAHLLQFIILLLFYILSNNISNKDNNILYKDSYYYNFLKNIIKYNKITEKYIKFIKKNQELPINNNDVLLQNNDYFYLFYNKYNIFIFFFKEHNSNIHNIYFNGINNKIDFDILLNTIFKLLSNNYSFEHISELINKHGDLYKILPNKVTKIIFLENNILKKNSLMNTFEYIYNKEYTKGIKDSYNNKINLNINGFSLGGVLSQVFVHNLLDKCEDKYKDKFNIQLFNIESWFGGNKDEFNNFIKKININNIYNKNSIFYFYNKIVQPYFNNISYIEDDEKNYCILNKNKISAFPSEIIKYINNSHFLSKIIK